MSVINRIKNIHTNAIISRCYEMGCRLKLNGLNNYIILKGEKMCIDRKICDCIIFISENYITVGIVELKSKTVHASEIVEKLTNGLKIALNILNECNGNCILNEFYLIVLHKSIHISEYQKIIRSRIELEGKKYNIIPKKCGTSFSALISKLK